MSDRPLVNPEIHAFVRAYADHAAETAEADVRQILAEWTEAGHELTDDLILAAKKELLARRRRDLLEIRDVMISKLITSRILKRVC